MMIDVDENVMTNETKDNARKDLKLFMMVINRFWHFRE